MNGLRWMIKFLFSVMFLLSLGFASFPGGVCYAASDTAKILKYYEQWEKGDMFNQVLANELR